MTIGQVPLEIGVYRDELDTDTVRHQNDCSCVYSLVLFSLRYPPPRVKLSFIFKPQQYCCAFELLSKSLQVILTEICGVIWLQMNTNNVKLFLWDDDVHHYLPTWVKEAVL